MLSITAAFGMVMALLGLFVLCVFSALIIGAYVHHRGVVVGSGNRESFTGVVPKGDVFRIPDAGSLPDEPEDHDPVDKEFAKRAGRLVDTMFGVIKGA